ncbi:MAG: sirohydrochlorin cobaltochelatase [Deltaproteobacteria bacterium]|jgi:sirohydrochlorin cobaltochelatase|nr:sirohydrochlorin cobaltochelatase [Deltaproteobacteria bacterium]
MRRDLSMILSLSVIAFFLAAAATQLIFSGDASAFERKPQKPAIVLAAFGTTDLEGLQSILNVQKRVVAAFPDYDVHLAFTSNIIRDIWHERAKDKKFRNDKANKSVPPEIYDIKNALTVLAGIQEEGARLILVQSLHVTDGEEYTDLERLVKALDGYNTVKPVLKPFPWIGLGAPAFGLGDGQPKYLERAVAALKPLVDQAVAADANLVLMGHGNEHLSQKIYSKLQAALRKAYNPNIYIGTVESPPHAAEIGAAIKKTAGAPANVFLAPMMVVAGDHARNDMAGEEPDSWISVLKAEGFNVTTHLEGLGSLDDFADIFIEHLKAVEPVVKAKEAKDNAGK